MRISSINTITNLSKYGLHTRFMRSMNTPGARATGAALGANSIWNSTWRTGGRPVSSSGKTSRNSLAIGYEVLSGFTSITSDDQNFTIDWDMENFLITEDFSMGTVSSIPTVLSWGGSIRPEVVVVGVPSIIKLSFVITDCWYKVLLLIEDEEMTKYLLLLEYLLNVASRRKIDQTLFTKRQKGDILLVQIYVDDMIFGSTNKDLCKAFEKLMKDKFQMSSMDELTFFLGLQVKQKPYGIFISQDKYVAEILRKFGLTDGKSASTPIDTEKPLPKDPDGEDVDVHTYRSMIGSSMYLTSSRPDIMYLTPKASHLHPVKMIFIYLKGKPHLGLWYPKDSPFNLVAYSDSDYDGASLDRKSTTGGCQFLGCRLISWQCKRQTVVAISSTEADLVRNVDSFTKFYMYPRFLQLMIRAQVGDLSSHSTKYSSLALTQKVFTNMRRVGKGFSRVDTTLFEGMIVAQQVDDVANEGVAGVDVDGEIIANMDVDEDVILKDVDAVAKEVEVEKTTEIEENADVQGRQAEYQVQIYKIDLEHADKVLNMQDDELKPSELKEVVEVVTTAKLMTEVVNAASATITAAITTITAATTPITAATITTAPSAAKRRKGVVIRDPEETATPSIIIHSDPKSKDKGKGILVEEPKPLKKQAQIEQDEAYARELEAELNKTINWDDMIDHVQRKEKEDNVMMKYQALKRKPQTEAQARKNMMIYLRNMVEFKMDYFKGMRYNDIRPIFEKYFNSNVAFLKKTKKQLEEEESRALKRKTESQAEKVAKKQKLDEEVEELRKHLQIVPNNEDDVYTEATPLARKVPVVDYEIYTGNNKPYYKIIRANGSPQLFLSFLSLLRNFDREDLEVLWQLVKERFAS
nr:uncharacterized mitochondrial protein AtMg00810-like [Tanacetum cinerariifolium]